MDVVTDMLIEPEAAALDEWNGEDRPGDRLAKLVGRLPGVRLLPSERGEPAALLVDEDETDAGGAPIWLAVAQATQHVAVLQDGAAGVVDFNVSGQQLAAAVEAVRHGHAVLPAGLLRSMLSDVDVDTGPAATRATGGPSLTPREDAVLSLLSEGATNKMIARRLDISVHTAKFHVASILDKLDATTRTDAVAQGVRQGLLML